MFGRFSMYAYAAATVVATAAMTGQTLAAEHYVASTRGTLPGDLISKNHAINNNQQIAGVSFIPGSPTVNAYSLTGARMTALGFLGGASSVAYAINASGQIAGKSRTAGGQDHAFLHNGTSLVDLGTLGGANSYGLGIDDSGRVVGQAQNAAGIWRAFLHDGVMSDLGTLGGTSSYAFAINESGQVAGYAFAADGNPRAFRWSQAAGMEDLGTLGGASSYAFGINDAGQVVGHSFTSGGAIHAFVWTEGVGLTDLGAAGGTNSYAASINSAGEIVGYLLTSAGAQRAFVHDGASMIDLNDTIPSQTGWTLERATSINDNGDIVGYGRLNGEVRGFLLTPCSGPDCNGNGFPDACDVGNKLVSDCNFNVVPDECDVTSGSSPDCNANNIPDECDLSEAIPGGSALMFNGVDGYVQVGAFADLVMTNAFTIEAWIYPTGVGTPAAGGIIVNKEGEYEISRFPDGTIQWAFANTTPGWVWTSTGMTAPLNEWTHVAVTYNGSQVRGYANGAPASAQNAAGSLGDVTPQWNDFRIGARQGTTQQFQGVIDEVRIWNVVRTPQSILANYSSALQGNETGLVGYWQFNEMTGTAAFDRAGNHDGELMAGVGRSFDPIIDCNANGTPDECDIAEGVSMDANGNGTPDDCEAMPPPDDRAAPVSPPLSGMPSPKAPRLPRRGG